MKSLIRVQVCLVFLFGIFMAGCASSDKAIEAQIAAEMAPIKRLSDEIQAEQNRLKSEISQLNLEYSKHKQDIADWELSMKTCNGKEFNFIKGLDDRQLQIYSEYEQSVKNNILAKVELYSRKLKASLSKEQKNELFNISDITKSLEGRRSELIKKQNELMERRKLLGNDIFEMIQREAEFRRYVYMRHSQLTGQPVLPSQSITGGLYAVQQSLERWQQNIQQQQQRMQMYSINQSLRDIASALKGY
jgi:hypothetical protein